MSYEEKDYFMRQIKKLAEGLGSTLTLNSVKEIIMVDQSENSLLSDEEIEAIILVTQVQTKADSAALSLEQLAEKTAIPQNRLAMLLDNTQLPTEAEIEHLKAFL